MTITPKVAKSQSTKPKALADACGPPNARSPSRAPRKIATATIAGGIAQAARVSHTSSGTSPGTVGATRIPAGMVAIAAASTPAPTTAPKRTTREPRSGSGSPVEGAGGRNVVGGEGGIRGRVAYFRTAE